MILEWSLINVESKRLHNTCNYSKIKQNWFRLNNSHFSTEITINLLEVGVHPESYIA